MDVAIEMQQAAWWIMSHGCMAPTTELLKRRAARIPDVFKHLLDEPALLELVKPFDWPKLLPAVHLLECNEARVRAVMQACGARGLFAAAPLPVGVGPIRVLRCYMGFEHGGYLCAPLLPPDEILQACGVKLRWFPFSHQVSDWAAMRAAAKEAYESDTRNS